MARFGCVKLLADNLIKYNQKCYCIQKVFVFNQISLNTNKIKGRNFTYTFDKSRFVGFEWKKQAKMGSIRICCTMGRCIVNGWTIWVNDAMLVISGDRLWELHENTFSIHEVSLNRSINEAIAKLIE